MEFHGITWLYWDYLIGVRGKYRTIHELNEGF